MSDRTGIEWTEATWNPVTGCTKVSTGCANCYAETFAERWRGTPGHPYEQGFDLKLWPERLRLPFRWRKPRRVFVNSMSDLFHEDVPDDFIAEVWGVMACNAQHTFQVLTKRPERARELLSDESWVLEAITAASEWVHRPGDGSPGNYLWEPSGDEYDAFPALPNVWLGVSIENRRFVGRADVLRETPAAVRFISAEPLLGPLMYDHPAGKWLWADNGLGRWTDPPLPDLNLEDIDWLIVGGESGGRPGRALVERDDAGLWVPKADALDWVRDLRDAAEAAGTAFFFKQWGGPRPTSGGRVLDGRAWSEFPDSTLERVA